MNTRRVLTAVGASLAVLASLPDPAHAQFGAFGSVNLPDNDFTWVWGNLERSRGREDLSLRGGEGGFRCTLKAGYAPGGRITMQEERALEAALQSTLYFIQEAAYTMSALERQRDIDWATLDCVRPEPEVDEAKQQERLEELRERALRKSQRRRERRDDG